MKLAIYLLIGGAALGFLGFQEMDLSSNSSEAPVEVSLAAIEAGEEVQNWVILQDAVAFWDASIFTYETENNFQSEPYNSSKILNMFYPVLSNGMGGSNSPKGRTKGLDFDNLAVVVKTDRFATYGDIPDGFESVEPIQGLFVEKTDPLDSEDRELLNSVFPDIDFTQIKILEEGREPNGGMALVFLIGGALMILLGGGMLILPALAAKDK